jgi:hypothetical protein
MKQVRLFRIIYPFNFGFLVCRFAMYVAIFRLITGNLLLRNKVQQSSSYDIALHQKLKDILVLFMKMTK